MEKIKRAMKKSITCAWNFVKFCGYWFWTSIKFCCSGLNVWAKKYEFISGIIVALLLIWVSSWVTGRAEQGALDKTTTQRLQLALVEGDYNEGYAKAIFDRTDTDADPNAESKRLPILIYRPSSHATLAAFQNANILRLIPLHRVSLLKSYVDSVRTLNQALQVHQGVLETHIYRSTDQENQIRQNVHDNAAALSAVSKVLGEELKDYVDNKLFDTEAAKKIQERIRLYKERALKNGISLPKGHTTPQ